jgi:hypothetical protein
LRAVIGFDKGGKRRAFHDTYFNRKAAHYSNARLFPLLTYFAVKIALMEVVRVRAL